MGIRLWLGFMYVTLCKDNQVFPQIQMHAAVIRTAINTDIPTLANLFRLATNAMIARGIGQWNYTYPLESHIRPDVQKGSCFVMESENRDLVATISLDFMQDAQYRKVGWNTYALRPMVVHRLAVHPGYQGRGYGRQMMLFAEERARQAGVSVIRLDAFSLNPVSLAMYHSLGYRRAAGYCYFHGISFPFYCFDKKIG